MTRRWPQWLIVVAGALLILAGVAAGGHPTVFTDTDDYYALGKELATDAGLVAPPELSDADVAQAKIDAHMGHTQMASRSAVYGVFLYGLESAGTLWLVTLAQALMVAWPVATLWRVALPGARRTGALIAVAVVTVLTPLPFFTGFAMPDILAGVGVLAAALLLIYPDRIGRAERWGLAALLVFAHGDPHLAYPADGGDDRRRRRRPRRARGSGGGRFVRRLGVLVAAIAVAVLANSLYGIGIRLTTGEPLRNQPFLTARLLADGPGHDYLRHACAAGEPLHAVPLRPQAARRFRGHPVVRPAGDRRVHAQRLPDPGQARGAGGALRPRHPRLRAGRAARGVDAQLGAAARHGLRRRSGPRPGLLPDRPLLAADQPAGDDRPRRRLRAEARPLPVAADGGGVEGVARRGGGDRGRRRAGGACCGGGRGGRPAARGWSATTAFLLAAVVVNAAVCGILSGPFARYQARIVWLVPLAAVLLVAGAADQARETAPTARNPGNPMGTAMTAETAIAVNRFGLGARPDEALPADPKRWLDDQMTAFEPRPAALADVPTSAAMAAQYHGFLLRIRDTLGTKAVPALANIAPMAKPAGAPRRRRWPPATRRRPRRNRPTWRCGRNCAPATAPAISRSPPGGSPPRSPRRRRSPSG